MAEPVVRVAMESFKRVEECRLKARQAINEEEKAAWLELAEEWLRLAQHTAVNLRPDSPLEPCHNVSARELSGSSGNRTALDTLKACPLPWRPAAPPLEALRRYGRLDCYEPVVVAPGSTGKRIATGPAGARALRSHFRSGGPCRKSCGNQR